jgi:hypothetical protein
MTSERDSDARLGARRLRDALATPGLAAAMAAYFDPAEGFVGMSFTCLGSNPRDQVTADDLLVVSLLDIVWRPVAVRMLLGDHAAKVSGLLGPIASDVDLWDATDTDMATVDPLWDALLDMPGIGTATAAKLLARKRPRLCPVTDRALVQASGVPGRTWNAIRCLMQDPDARAQIEALRPPLAAGASLLQILDVAIWISRGRSHAAQRARTAGTKRGV